MLPSSGRRDDIFIMTLNERVLKIVQTEPGSSKRRLRKQFGLSDYRLRRVFRQINRQLNGRRLVHHDAYGVWVVEIDPKLCAGIEWAGIEEGGVHQCKRSPEFDDGCCYEHSQCENLEMTAFKRKLASLTGPADPSVYVLSQLSIPIVEELISELKAIEPLTRKDHVGQTSLAGMLAAAFTTLMWKERLRRQRPSGPWADPELGRRHRESSVNPFEYSLRRHFAVLEVSPKATREEVVKAWRKLARRYHPDSEDGDEERMKVINLAKDRIFRIRKWE